MESKLREHRAPGDVPLEPIPTGPEPARNEVRPRPGPDPFRLPSKARPPPSAPRAEVLTGAELGRVEPAWQDLVDHALEENAFYEPWMVHAALKNAPRGLRLKFVLVWSAQAPQGGAGRTLWGLFPLVEERVKGLGLRVLRTWEHPFCYLGVPLVRRGHAPQALGMFLDWLGAQGDVLLRLDQVPGEGPWRKAWVDAVWRRGWPTLLGDAWTRAFFRPAASGEEYLARALRGKRRKELRRLQARLAEVGRLDFCEPGPNEDVRPWLEEFVELEARGWKGREGVCVKARERERAFFLDALRQAALRDRLMVSALRLDGRAIAMKVNLLSKEGSFAFKIAYDETLARYSPGVLLELDNIQRLHARTDVGWMDSCASPNRFMLNQLWTDRRELHTVYLSAGGRWSSLALAAVPLRRWARRVLLGRSGPASG